jgi:hypothetical protein
MDQEHTVISEADAAHPARFEVRQESIKGHIPKDYREDTALRAAIFNLNTPCNSLKFYDGCSVFEVLEVPGFNLGFDPFFG